MIKISHLETAKKVWISAGAFFIIEWNEITEDEYKNEKCNKITFSMISKKYFVCNNEYFNIIATPDMFNMQDKVVEGVDIKQKVEWPDPIVLKAVKYGYLIVSVWGQELAIEKARNERNN